MIRKSLALLLCGAGLNVAGGQTKAVQDVLLDAQKAYQASSYEQAKQLLTTVLTTKQQVTTQQKVTAYTYMGGFWAIQAPTKDVPAPKDSATAYFIAAIDLDPFTSLDPAVFFGEEQGAFGAAKAALYRVGMDPMHAQNLNPNPAIRTADIPTSYTLRVASTQSGKLSTRIRSVTRADYNEDLQELNSNGIANIQWNGLIQGQRADTGIYEIVLTGVNTKGDKRDSVKQRFRIEQVHAPLEDTLSSFADVRNGPSDTLVSRRAATVPYSNAAKGLFAGLIAASLPLATFGKTSGLTNVGSHAAIGALVGLGSGAISWFYANGHREDSKAAGENTRRKQVRADFNAGVRARNQARLDRTILVIRPLNVSGTGN